MSYPEEREEKFDRIRRLNNVQVFWLGIDSKTAEKRAFQKHIQNRNRQNLYTICV